MLRCPPLVRFAGILEFAINVPEQERGPCIFRPRLGACGSGACAVRGNGSPRHCVDCASNVTALVVHRRQAVWCCQNSTEGCRLGSITLVHGELWSSADTSLAGHAEWVQRANTRRTNSEASVMRTLPLKTRVRAQRLHSRCFGTCQQVPGKSSGGLGPQPPIDWR
jgi:hypothetical protein